MAPGPKMTFLEYLAAELENTDDEWLEIGFNEDATVADIIKTKRVSDTTHDTVEL